MRIIELFGGIGAVTRSLTRLGINVELVDYVEIDKYAVKSFNAINGTSFEPQDITKWNKHFENIDLISHGSPCQDFSVAGKQAGGDEGSGTRSSLMYETLRIVQDIKPKYVIWENVKNLLSKKHRHNFDKYVDIMNEGGYNSYFKVLNAKDFGIPQNRERVYTISIRKDIDKGNFEFPQPEELKLKLKDMLEAEVDEKYYLSNKTINYILDGNNVALNSGMNINNRVVNPEIAKTISCRSVETNQRAGVSTFVIDGIQEEIRVGNLKEQLCDYLLENNKVKEYDVIDHSYSKSRKEQINNGVDIVKGENESPTLTTRTDTLGIVIKTNNKKGYDIAIDGDSINTQYPNSTTRRGRVGHQVSQTIQCDDSISVVENKPKVIGGFGKVGSTNQYHLQNRIYDNNVGISICTTCNPNYIDNNLRIRKLTPKECWRLMGFRDEEFERAEKVNSNAQLYKQAGNSIVVNMLEKIFRNLFYGDQNDNF